MTLHRGFVAPVVLAGVLCFVLGSATSALGQADTAPPESLTVDTPADSTFRRASDTLTVGYSYEEANPDTALIAFEDESGNAAVFQIDDRGYAGDNREKTETLALSAPDSTEGQRLTDGSTYALRITAIDTAGNAADTSGNGTLTIDETAPTISAVALGNDGSDTLAFELESDERLASIAVTVDGPNTEDVYSFDETDFSESGSGPYTYTLSTTQAYGDDGEYTAVVDEAVDDAGNDGADGESDRYTLDTTAPADLTLDQPGSEEFRETGQDLEVGYSYSDEAPSSASITFADGAGNAATYELDDSGYAGDNTEKTVSLTLNDSSADETSGDGLVDGATYDITVEATDEAGNSESATGADRLTLDASLPTVEIASPDDGDVVPSQDAIEGTASDNVTVASVELAIQRESDDQYWDGGGWVAAETAVAATATDGAFDSESEDWSYDASGITGDDTYAVTATAVDGAGNEGTSSTISYTIDTTAPSLESATVTADRLFLDYDELLDSGSEPSPGDFTVEVDGETTPVSSVAVTADTTLLTLDAAVGAGEAVTVDYDSAGASARIRDRAGNAASGLSGRSVTNQTEDTTPPTISAVSLGNDGSDTLALEFESDERLASIAVTVDGPNTEEVYSFERTDFSESGSSPYTYTLSATQVYDDGEGEYMAVVDQAVDDAGNDGADGESDRYTFDPSPPTVEIASPDDGDVVPSQDVIDGTASDSVTVASVELTIQRESDDQYWDGSEWTSGETTVEAAGTEQWTYDASAITGEDTYAVTATATDGAGNEATSSTIRYTIDTTSPTLQTASVEADSLVLDYDEPLDSGSVPSTGAFTVEVDGEEAELSSVGVSADTTLLTLDAAVGAGEAVTVDYDSAGASARIRDRAGNAASGLTDQAVTNTEEDATVPTATIDIPSDGALVQSQDVIEGTASDNVTVASVELTIQRQSDDQYWDGGGWVEAETAVPATPSDGAFDSGSEDWTYDASGITGDDTYAVAATAVDAEGNTSSSSTIDYTIDSTAPESLALTRPGSEQVRQPGQDLEVGYSYVDDHPANAALTVADGSGNAATYEIDDGGYAGDGSEKTVALTLSNSSADETSGDGLVEGATYDITVEATDEAGNSDSDTGSDLLTIDASSPTAEVEFPSDGAVVESQDAIDGTASDNVTVASVELTIQRESDDRYWDGEDWEGSASTVDAEATDGAFDSESEDWTYDASGITGDDTYAVTATAVDGAGNESPSSTISYTIDATAPAISNVSLQKDGANILDFRFESDEQLSSMTVTVDGPEGGTDIYSFDGEDFEESDGFVYTLTTEQAYDRGHGTYEATVDDAVDEVGNNGGASGTGSGLSADYTDEAPTAEVDDVTTDEDSPRSVAAPGVLDNDTDPDGDDLSVYGVEGGDGDDVGSEIDLSSGAQVTLSGDGAYTYDPNGQFEALAAGDETSDSFTYRATDGIGPSNQVTTFVTVDGVNDSPTIRDTSASTAEDDQLSANALLNDSDPDDGDELTVAAVEGEDGNVGTRITLSSRARLEMSRDGSYEYDPASSAQFDRLGPGDTGTDTFTYTAEDGNGGAGQATVTIEVTGENDPPVVATNEVLAVQSQGVSELITTSDLSAEDPDDPPAVLTFDVTEAPVNGRITVDGSEAGSFTQKDLEDEVVRYEHDGSSTSTDSLTFDLTDAQGAGPTGRTFEMVVGLNNNSPIARDDDASTSEDDVLAVDDPSNGVLANDTDPNGDPLSVSAVNGVSEDVGTQITLSSSALLTIDEDGTYTYEPNGAFDDLAADESTTESFSYTAADGRGGTDQATVTITVTGVNDAPVLTTVEGIAVTTGGEETLTTGNLDATDPDDEASALEYALTDGPSQGRILVDGSEQGTFTQEQLEDGDVTYDHTADSGDDDQFTFDLTDDDGAGPTGTTFSISVSFSNRPPTASDDRYSVPEDETLAVTDSTNGVLGNDTDPDGDPLRASIASTPQHGNLSFNEDGTFEYAPDSNYNGPDGFAYQVSDGNGGTDRGTVDLTVTAVNDPPRVAVNEGLAVNQKRERTITTSVLSASDVDDEAADLTFTVTDGPTQGQLVVEGATAGTFTQQQLENGEVVYDHTANTLDDDRFTFDLTDDDGAGPTGQSFAIAVGERNFPPTARDTTLVTSEDTAATGEAPGILDNDSDPDGDPLSVAGVDGGGGSNIGSELTLDSGARLTVRGNGAYVYDPNGQFEGLTEGETVSETVPYTVSDGNGGTDEAAVTFTVEGKNETPTVTLTAPVDGALVQADEPVPLRAEAQDADGSVQEVSFRADGTTVGRDEGGEGGFAVDWTPRTSGTVELTAEATDDDGATAVSEPVAVRVRSARVGLSVQRSFPNPTQQSSFRLVALPGQTTRSLASTLSGQSPDDWRAFREAGATGAQAYRREECEGGDCSFRPGTGFWLTARSPWAVEDSVEAVSLQADSSISGPVRRLALHDGWNIVSNPLETDVSWAAVQAASGTNQLLWRWEGGWTRAQTFASAAEGEAYYVRDDALDSLVVPFDDGGDVAARTADSSNETRGGAAGAASAGAQLSLSVVAAGDTVSTVAAGMRPDAEESLDRLDRYGPPGFFGTPSLRLIETTNDRRHVLAAEYKPVGQDGYAYDVRLRASPDTAVALAVHGFSSVSRAQVTLVRRPTGRTYDLRADSALTVVPREETTRFRLLIGSDAFVERETRAVAPEQAELLPNYPEPVRRSTTIEYALPEQQTVRLAVYDLLGRRVEVLVDGPRSAGFHRLRWPEGGGDPLASGTYFLRLKTDATVKTERVTVVR